MLCDRCKMKEAKVYYTEIVNGKKIEQHLCEDCAAELTSFQKELPLESILSGLFGGMNVNTGNETICPSCGMTYQEFRREGKFGCADCYRAFGRFLPGTLKRIQGSAVHTGKVPRSWQQAQEEKKKAQEIGTAGANADGQVSGIGAAQEGTGRGEDRIVKAEKALREAVAKEEFEEAARLRDRIRVWKKEADAQAGSAAQEQSASEKEKPADQEASDRQPAAHESAGTERSGDPDGREGGR